VHPFLVTATCELSSTKLGALYRHWQRAVLHKRAKGGPPEKNTIVKKELLTLLWVTLQMGKVEVNEDNDE
jgi:hypothetical protein